MPVNFCEEGLCLLLSVSRIGPNLAPHGGKACLLQATSCQKWATCQHMGEVWLFCATRNSEDIAIFFWQWKEPDQVLTWLQIKSSLGIRRILLQRANRLSKKKCVPDLAGSLLMELLKKVMFCYWWKCCPWLTGCISAACGSLPTASLAHALDFSASV